MSIMNDLFFYVIQTLLEMRFCVPNVCVFLRERSLLGTECACTWLKKTTLKI